MVSQQKVVYVNSLYDILSKSKIIGIANVIDIPTDSLQEIRKKLKSMGPLWKLYRCIQSMLLILMFRKEVRYWILVQLLRHYQYNCY